MTLRPIIFGRYCRTIIQYLAYLRGAFRRANDAFIFHHVHDAGGARSVEDGLELRRDTVIDTHAIEGDVEEVGGAVSHGTRQPGLIFELEQMDATHADEGAAGTVATLYQPSRLQQRGPELEHDRRTPGDHACEATSGTMVFLPTEAPCNTDRSTQ